MLRIHHRLSLLITALTLCAACSSTGSGSTGTGAATSSSGSGTTSSGTTTTTLPPADAAWAITTTQPDASTCLIAANADAFGVITSAAKTMEVTSGAASGDGGTAMVSCAVEGTGPFDVNGVATSGSVGLQITIPSLPAGASAASPATGTVSYKPSESKDLYTGTCGFYFVSGTPEAVAAGTVFVAFTCPGLTDTIGMSTCPVTESYVAFDGCVSGT